MAEQRRFLRQYALTGGRARSSAAALPLDTLVQTNTERNHLLALQLEQRRILELCRSPQSLAEISAHLKFHLGVARVLVGDLSDLGLVHIRLGDDRDEGPDLDTLERLLDDLQAL